MRVSDEQRTRFDGKATGGSAFRWFWRFLAMAIIAGVIAFVASQGGLSNIAALAYVGIVVAIGLAGISVLVGIVVFIFRKAMES